jgi:hypothetical protein
MYLYIHTNVLEKHTVSIFRAEVGLLGSGRETRLLRISESKLRNEDMVWANRESLCTSKNTNILLMVILLMATSVGSGLHVLVDTHFTLVVKTHTNSA